MNKSSGNLKCVFAVSKMVTKLSQIREKSNKRKIADLLENSSYFQKIIHDPEERQEFLEHATKYVKYKFYPKGTLIHGFNEVVHSFSIIAKGKAYLYTPKKTEQAKREYHNFQKSQVIKEYNQFICNQKLEEKLKQWLCKKEFGTRSLRKRHDMVVSGSDITPRNSNTAANNDMSTLDEYNEIIEKILKDKSEILPVHLHDYDLTKTEKLLLLSHFGLPGDYMKDGVFTIQMTKELKSSDVFGEIGLLKPVNVDYAVIAVEDVHLVSFTRDDYRELFTNDEIRNFRDKVEFLGRAFSETSTQSLMKIAYFLEERVLNGRETLYKEGEDPKAIYFIKKGEVQLLLQEKKANTTTSSVSEIKSKSLERHSNKHNKLVIGNLQAGSMFGEEEIIQKTKRGYTAVSTSPQTILYVLRNDIFTEMFDKHLPHIASLFKDWMKVKSQWRKQRIGAEKEIKTYFESSNDKKPTSIETPSKKLYVLQKEQQEIDPTSGLAEIEDRTILKRIAKRDVILNAWTPTKPNPQSSNEYQIFSRQIFEDLSPVKKSRSKNKIVSLADTQSTKIGTLTSLVPSINDLMSPSSKVFDSRNNIDKSKTLNNELVSGGQAPISFSKKAQTVLTLENEVPDNLEFQPTFSVMRNIKPPSFNDFVDVSPKVVPSSMNSTSYLPKVVGMSDSLKTPERPSKLSKGGMKILSRITSHNQVEDFERGSTEYGFKTPERQRKMMRVSTRNLTKLSSFCELDSKPNDRSVESGKLKKEHGLISIKNLHIMNSGGQVTSPRNRRLERANTQTLSIKNLELKI